MKKQFLELFNFFGAWFPDMDYDGLSEEIIINNYKKAEKREIVQKVILQAEDFKKELMNKQELLDILIKETNIYFEIKSDANIWLNKIIRLLINSQ